MPPQPLSSVRRNATVRLDPLAPERRPALAGRIATIIAIWSRIDSDLAAILAYMLKGELSAAIAMYSALTSSQAQMAALEAAARVSLADADRPLFGAVLSLVKRAGAKRNRIAHWLWGESDELPDALILADPDALLSLHTGIKDFIVRLEKGEAVATPNLDTKRAFVYRADDFRELVTDLMNVHQLTLNFSMMLQAALSTPALAESLRNQLLALPQIQEEFRRSRVSRHSEP
jgi:hypothetical protein